METIIQSHPAVNGAVIAGVERFQSSLLVETKEPPKDDTEREKLLEEIWPTVEKANKESPSHGRLHRDMVLFTNVDRPMPRAGKGTVIRQATLDLYATEIEVLYRTSGANTTSGCGSGQYSSVKDAARSIVSRTASIDLAEVPADANLFELGLDSLQVTAIVKETNKYLMGLGKPAAMSAPLVYRHPSLEALVSVFEALCEGKEVPERASETDEERMQTLYDLHTADLPMNGRAPEPQEPGKACVLLTGSTGSLGSYILDSLIARDDVARIYCLNRGTNSFERQQKSQAAKGLAPLPVGKVRCIDAADLSRAYLGLPVQEYKRLLNEVTLVVHNAWQVDFNLPLASFTGHVGAVRRLVDLAAHSRLGVSVLFVSSVGAVAEWATNNTSSNAAAPTLVPEVVVEDWRASQRSGYGQAKLVAERILDAVAQTAGVPAAICRAGQVAGPSMPGPGGSSSSWPRQEWVPSLVASSKHLGLLPGSLVGGAADDRVDWVPVDALGRIVVELGLGFLDDEQQRRRVAAAPAGPSGATVYHAVNPKVTRWEELVPIIAEALGGADVVPLESWVAALRESAPKTEDLAVNPAVKILDFYEGMVGGSMIHLDTKNTVQHSTTLAELGPVDGNMMKRWMEQWAF
jgi:thioester reductase-like protein